MHIAAMAQMNISIPDKLKAWVESRVSGGDYASSSDYLRDLVRRDQREQEALRRLQGEIDLGRASGTSDRDLKQIIAATRAQHEARDAA